jgi:dihydropteroate synthase
MPLAQLPFRFQDRQLSCDGNAFLMGILNVTPDSFSDGGSFQQLDQAVAQGLELAKQGAQIIDVGGESTRPGHQPVSADEETRRVVPVIRELKRQLELPISIDSSKACVAEAAIKAGASIINDVSAGENDPLGMAALLRKYRVGCILMHSQPLPADAQCGEQAAAAIAAYFRRRLDCICAASGSEQSFFMLDPGIGFNKNLQQNLSVIKQLGRFRALGCPVLLGPSRKSFLGHITGQKDPLERVWATAGAAAAAVILGADVLRVHDLKPMRDVVRVAAAIANAD